MNTKSKYRLTLLFSLIVFGGFGVGTQAQAATTGSTQSSTEVQSISNSKSTVSANPANGTSSNTSADTDSEGSSSSQLDDSKANKNSDSSSVTTTYGDAKDNQVKPTDNDDTSDAKGETTAVSESSVSSATPQQTTTQQADSESESTASESTSSTTSSSSATSSDLNAGASVVGAGDDAIDNVVKTVVDKVIPDADKSDSDVQAQTASSAVDTPDDSTVVLESPDTAQPGKTEETLIVPDQTIIESSNVHNDIVGDTFADKVTNSDPKAVKAASAITSNKTKLLTFNAFSNTIYRHVLKTAQKPGTITTVTGSKATLTTPVKHVKYMEHDSTGISETLPVMATLAVIAVAGVTFIAFDPLRFLFK
ncbi:hypothetical protein K9P40_05415 [Lentilactobacillus otakiensis]|uniref:hypothetical protein n=1 Tax=Lentilactobacillus otakiensis TaxID=481720 RepID=UPI001CC06396|nr:hypothetical protein [Lentilactobacillus otakiensis]MBZ3776515.1 hypothetical protein [Lentilactobacillus otakiensis]